MSVIISDMGIPKCCSDCPILYDQMYCSITESKVNWGNYDKSRLDDCPLKEVPSGKWIPVTEIQNMRKEMSTISRVTDGERDILFTCLAMIDDLIEGYFEEQQGDNT